MRFDSQAYGPLVAAILALGGDGLCVMPLAEGVCGNADAFKVLQSSTACQLFPHSRAAEAAFAGLYLYFSCRDEAHTLVQDLETPEGSFWHGIVHRQEPDAGNSAYWFRRTGPHPVFSALREEASGAGMDLGERWDPFAFIEFCEEARRKPGSEQERKALAVQLAEWQLLFDYCAARAEL
jgi:hypothetical protein